MKSIYSLIIFSALIIYGQDSTRIQAFRDDFPQQKRIVKAKYPSYSLIAGYILVSDANRGDPFAAHELGIRYLTGSGFPKDTVKAVYWIRKAADMNLPAARFNYGIMLYNGDSVPWNPFEAYINWKIASDANLPEAQFALGLAYSDNLIAARDLNKAYQFFKLSAASNYKPAKEMVDRLLSSGFIPPNDSTASHRSIKSEDSSPLLNPKWDLEYYYFTDDANKTTDSFIHKILKEKKENLKLLFGIDKPDSSITDTTSAGLLDLAARNDSPEALVIIAHCYEKGIKYRKDLSKAAAYYLRAYRLGSFKAANSLNRLIQEESFMNYLKERINKNDAEAMYAWAGIAAAGMFNQIANQQALDFLRKAVDQKHIPSMIELGLLYLNGVMVEKDKEKAIGFWKLAKDLGSSEAEVRIILSGILDDPNSPDNAINAQTLRRIADQGSVFAQSALAYCYEKGIGVREDKGLAVKLYRSASQRGNQSASNSLKRMYDEIRPEDDQFKIYEINQ